MSRSNLLLSERAGVLLDERLPTVSGQLHVLSIAGLELNSAALIERTQSDQIVRI